MKQKGFKNAFYEASSKAGVSLIILVITIIIIIILASSVIIAMTQNNPVDMANDAVFRSDLSEIQTQLDLYVTGQYAENLNFDESQMRGKVSDYIPGATKYDSEFKVENGYLEYSGTDEKKIGIARDMQIVISSDVAEVGTLSFNKPDLSYLSEATTQALKWNTNNVETKISLSTAKTDTSWYDYSSETKHWANILTNNNGNTAYWVWIPRYAYKIDNSHSVSAEQIHIIFLAGTSDNPIEGGTLPTDYTVHPAFIFGEKNLTGIWVAKYEASSSTPDVMDSDGYTGGGDNVNLQVRIQPNVYSWRNISSGNIQTVSMNMTSSQGSIGTTTNVDTHQMKNIEWGAVAYLSQSQYGQKPWINPCGNWGDGQYKMKTGYSGEAEDSGELGPESSELHQYNDLTYGGKSSTTGNIYGVYDMIGGSFEITASILNNGNENLGIYGSTYVQNNKIKPEYAKYYDIYEPGDEEKEGGAYYGTGGTTLWASSNTSSKNTTRRTITYATYAKMANKKGDGMYETSNGTSYFGKYTSGSTDAEWLKDTTRSFSQGSQLSSSWNNGYMLTGYAYLAWLLRGGTFSSGNTASLFYVNPFFGDGFMDRTFRPVLVNGLDL